jgi:1,2-diacylglycerol 3-beta-glucosyltransferase
MMALGVCIAALLPSLLAAIFYFVFTWLVPRQPPLPTATADVWPLTVLIPAHNEETGIASTIASVLKADYPAEARTILVIADNCTDATADVARRAGASVLVRTDPTNRGKGQALAFGIQHALQSSTKAILVLDADCTISPGLLHGMNAMLFHGCRVVQAALHSTNAEEGTAAFIASVGTEVDNAVANGLDRVVGRVPLRGTGMLFRRDVLEQVPWSAMGKTEDAEYASKLRAADIAVRLLPLEFVRAEAPVQPDAFLMQRRRWCGALRVPGTNVFHRFLYSKPLVLLAHGISLMLYVACAPFLAESQIITLGLLLLVVFGMTTSVYVRAIRRVGWSRISFRNWVAAPFLIWRMGLLALGIGGSKPNEWQRTPRGTT